MAFFINTTTGEYYRGDKYNHTDVEVPERPSDYHAWIEGQWVEDVTAAKAARLKVAEEAIEKMLDDGAKEVRYKSIDSACSYAACPTGTPFQAEGISFAVWRSKCEAKMYKVFDDVAAGKRAEPTPEELVAEMPKRVMP